MNLKEQWLFVVLFILSIGLGIFNIIRLGNLTKQLVSIDNKTARSFTYQNEQIGAIFEGVGQVLQDHKKQIEKMMKSK